MTAPQPVSERALQRLRRRYAWLMLALAAPVLVAAVYVLSLQYEILRGGVQRQLVTGAERRVAQLDAVLGRTREDLLRLGQTVRAPGLLARDVRVDKRSLAAGPPGLYTLDALPVLLREAAPQVILAGAGWNDPARRDAVVERAALFAEQAQLAMTRGGRFARVTYVDVDAGAVWIYPWVPSAQWLAELRASPADPLARLVARQAGVADDAATPIGGEVRWRVRDGADGRRLATLSAPVAGEGGLRLVVADVPLSALDAARIEPASGRFWVVDGDARVVLDLAAAGAVAGTAGAGAVPPPVFPPEQVAAALESPLAVEIDGVLAAARPSAVAPWVAFHARDGAEVRHALLLRMGPYVAGGALLLVLFLAIATFIWRHFGQPSLRLVDYLHRQAQDPNAAEPKVPGEWVPWLRLTRDTFAAWRAAAAREQKTEALKSAIVDHALAAVVTTDARGNVVEFNPAAQRMFSRSREETIGQPASGTIVSPRVRDAYVEDLRRINRGEAPLLVGRRVEMTALRRDGSEFPVDVVLWRTQVGDEAFVTASLFDLSERRAAAEEIERQREALRQSEKLAAMGSLLAGVAHELNNPLAIVMGRASLLEDKCADPALRADATRIREAAERCGRIVRTFLAMARRRPAQRAPVQLNDLVRGAVDLLQYGLRTAGVSVEQRLRPDLPAVMADADKLGQVLLNLVVNAQQALAQVDPPRLLCIETGLGAGGVWLRVADNGPGVAGSNRDRIFEAFVTTKDEGVGTGLGLAVSRSVALEHGGGLVLEDASPFGRGASFRLDLPLRAAAQDGGFEIANDARAGAGLAGDSSVATNAPASEYPAPGHPPPREYPGAPEYPAMPECGRVLVVDDEAEVAAMMRDALEAAGYEVAVAESGAVAIALLDEARFDVVVSDLRMPDVDGRALWRAIRERDPGLASRFVFVTGDALSPLAAEFGRESGAEGLEKPFDAAELVRRVRRLACAARNN